MTSHPFVPGENPRWCEVCQKREQAREHRDAVQVREHRDAQ